MLPVFGDLLGFATLLSVGSNESWGSPFAHCRSSSVGLKPYVTFTLPLSPSPCRPCFRECGRPEFPSRRVALLSMSSRPCQGSSISRCVDRLCERYWEVRMLHTPVCRRSRTVEVFICRNRLLWRCLVFLRSASTHRWLQLTTKPLGFFRPSPLPGLD